MTSFKMPIVGREIPQILYHCYQYSFSYSYITVNVFLEGDGAGSWWKPLIFLDEAGQEMEESLRAQRLGTQNDVLYGAWPPPTECDFEGPHNKISAMGPEFPATALRAITVSGPLVYHHVFTPSPPFLTVTRLKSFSPHGGGRITIDPPHKQVPLLHAHNDQCQAFIFHSRTIFPRSLANEIHYPLWCGWGPVAKSTRQGW